jgi:autotransporter-associated beta strand protein
MTLNANRGITIGAGGGVIRQGFGIFNIAGPLTGAGPLRITGVGSNSAGTRMFSGVSDGSAAGAAAPYTGMITLATDTPVYANATSALGIGTITNDPAIPAIFGTSSGGSVTLAGNVAVNPGHTWDWSISNPGGDLTIGGVISGAGTMYKGLNNSSPGTLELTNAANSFTGDFVISQGTLSPVADGALGSTSSRIVVNGTGVVALKGNLNYTSPKPLFLASAISPSFSAALSSTSGNNTFAGPITLTSSAGIAVTAGAKTLTNDIVGAADSVIAKGGTGLLSIKNVRSGGLALVAGTLKILPSGGAASGVSNVRTLTLPAGTKLDLTDNKLITAAAIGSWNGSAYTGVSGLTQSGRNGGPPAAGNWAGSSGIVTSQTQATTAGVTSIGIATARQVKALTTDTDTAVWSGQTVTGSDTLVMYTYGGDANLDGKINVDDYGHIDSSIGISLTGWFNGDFNYDGKLNVDDYGIIDFNIGIQGPPFFSEDRTAASPTTAVPEPTVPMLLLIGASLPWPRRKRAP